MTAFSPVAQTFNVVRAQRIGLLRGKWFCCRCNQEKGATGGRFPGGQKDFQKPAHMRRFICAECVEKEAA